jgi:hypothetical protein
MMKGDVAFADRMVNDMINRKSRSPIDSHVGDEHRRLTVSAQCQKLVACLEGWTMYDLVLSYYGPYVDDQGKIEDNADIPGASTEGELWDRVNEIRTYLKLAKSSNYAFANCQQLLRNFFTNGKCYQGPP